MHFMWHLDIDEDDTVKENDKSNRLCLNCEN